ncbi:MAG: hypothetical protein AB1938_01435 [Myxococcota bacterium]
MPTDPDNPDDLEGLEEEELEEKPSHSAADLFPFDELSTGETSSLLKRARLVTGLQDDPVPVVDPTLKPTTGRFLALQAAASAAGTSKPVTGTNPAFKPGTGANPAFKPGTGANPAFKPGTGANPAFKPGTGANPALKPGTGSHAALDPSALQREIRQKALHDGKVAPPPGTKPPRPVKPPLAAEDTFVKKKIRQAENNLPDWDFDDDDEGG